MKLEHVTMSGLVVMGMQFCVAAEQLQLSIEAGEYWWGGLSSKGHEALRFLQQG